MDNVQSNIFIAGQRLNDLTGYSGIEALKKETEYQEIQVQETREALKGAREAYAKAISQRSTSQRESNELLQRKHAWTPDDLERFTTLYRSDHANEMSESAARENLTTIERKAEEAAALLSKSILARYHEEQIWSDKIRRMSTWGTWGLMGVNVLLFLVFQIGVEPWRRKRLVKGFEDKVMEALEREDIAIKERGKDQEIIENVIIEEPITIAQVGITDGQPDIVLSDDVQGNVALNGEFSESTVVSRGAYTTQLQSVMRDLFSERDIRLRRVDLTTFILEGVAAGAAFGSLIFLFMRPR